MWLQPLGQKSLSFISAVKMIFFYTFKAPIVYSCAVLSNIWQKKKKKTLHKHHFCTHIVYFFQNCILKEAKRSHLVCPLACLPVGFYFLF